MLLSVRVRKRGAEVLQQWTIVSVDDGTTFSKIVQKAYPCPSSKIVQVRVGKATDANFSILQDESLKVAEVTQAFGSFIDFTIETPEPQEVAGTALLAKMLKNDNDEAGEAKCTGATGNTMPPLSKSEAGAARDTGAAMDTGGAMYTGATVNSMPNVSKNGRFSNPFETWKEPGLMTVLKWKLTNRDHTNLPAKEDLNKELPVLKPSFHDNPSDEDMHVTWLGHATTLVQFDGITILTDPVFSDRCGPSQNQLVSHKRFRPVPCSVEDLPKIHAVVISHSNYDHLDHPSVVDLNDRYKESLHWFVPLKLKTWFTSVGCQNVHELNWWDEVALPDRPDIRFVLTPTQHWSGRNLVVDHNATLWGSWCVLGPKHRFYFAGDTGYCKAFQEIGQKYGPFDLAALPIGAYLPRSVMAPQHVDPAEAVNIHRDIKAKKSVGIHWGTFALANEYYLQPPKDLAKALKEKGVSEEDFFVLDHGESKTL